jgi:hypothetical protein
LGGQNLICTEGGETIFSVYCSTKREADRIRPYKKAETDSFDKCIIQNAAGVIILSIHNVLVFFHM